MIICVALDEWETRVHRYTHSTLAKADGVGVLTLSRPDQLNAYSVAVLDEPDGDDHVRAMVIPGAGRAFCPGMDLSGPAPFAGDDDAARRRGGEALQASM